MKSAKTYPANRYTPGAGIKLDPDFVIAHWHDIGAFALSAKTEHPFDIVVEFERTGRLMCVHPGHSTILKEFIKTLKKENH